jgi:hypothetical protein
LHRIADRGIAGKQRRPDLHLGVHQQSIARCKADGRSCATFAHPLLQVRFGVARDVSPFTSIQRRRSKLTI